MADPHQLEILKQGVKIWNDWRHKNPEIEIDLAETNLKSANLSGANLWDVDLSEAILWQADLIRADLEGANLRGSDFSGANLNQADLSDANLNRAYLIEANLGKADLSAANLSEATLLGADLAEANISGADLRGADFSEADLFGSNFYGVNLVGAKFLGSRCWVTVFNSCDLSEAIDLDKIKHEGPSTVGAEALRLSKGKIPESFLRGCGLSDWEIESAKLYAPDLSNDQIIDIQNNVFRLRAQQPLQISSLFISYSHADGAFVDKLETHLIKKGIRFWRDVHHATAGRLEKVIDRAMRLNPTVLLVLSKDSITSDWVEHEVNNARKLEKGSGRDVLCPVTLDDEWKKPNSWSQILMDQVKKYNILDFSMWQDDDKFNAMFGRLVEGLDLFYKK